MNIRYLCKKEYTFNSFDKGEITVRYGDLIQVEFETYEARITTVHRGAERIVCDDYISNDDLKEHFYIYDEMGTLEPVTALSYFINKFACMTKESEMLKDLRYYINERKNFLKTCNKEDTQQEQN